MDEYARFAPATGAGEGLDWACCAAALALRRASSILRICSGVGGFGGSLPAERVARGGVVCLSDMLKFGSVVCYLSLVSWRRQDSSRIRTLADSKDPEVRESGESTFSRR